MRGRWFLLVLLGAAIGAVLYAGGVPGPIVYVIRGVAMHLAYTHGGGH